MNPFHETILRILTAYLERADWGSLENRIIATDADYLLIRLGWQGEQRVYEVIIHLAVRDDTLWVECDHSYDILHQLLEAGVPRERIVLGEYPASYRQYTDFAVR